MNKCFLPIITLFLFLIPLFAQTPSAQQVPPIGLIDFYGLKTVPEEDVLAVLTIKPGDDWLKTIQSVEENRKLLKALPKVEDASISIVCCDNANGKSMVFVGIREKGEPILKFRTAPTGNIRLPEEILQADKDFEAAFMEALKAQDFSEDDSQGHALFGNKSVREVQERFIILASRHLKILRQALHESSDPKQRALAAEILAYSSNKQAIVGDLVFGVDDSDEHVRNDSMRALIVLAKYAQANPKRNIKIPMNVFVRMLNSLEWTDRNKSAGALDELTKSRNPALLASLKREALFSLTEMAVWKNPGHAQAAFNILGRLAGFSEKRINEVWKENQREYHVQKMLEIIQQ